MSEDSGFVAPYVPFQTFETGLNKLAALGGIPPKIDHTVFQQMGGVQKGQVISAFKFLGLIDADGVPVGTLLNDLALDRDNRKVAIRKLIKGHYPNITEQDLATMSPGQLDTKLADKGYNVSGATRQKARSFLLKAAEFAGVPLSKLLTAKGPRGPRKASKKSLSASTAGMKPLVLKEKLHERQSSGDERTVQLQNGGSVTLSVDVNILDLEGKDREFVFELIDKLKVYQKDVMP